MASLLTFIFILIASILVTKVAAIFLVHTGLSYHIARFQATSAFTGVGYPGKEAEQIINHPIRRRIIIVLMLLGKAGLVSIIATFLIAFLQHNDTQPTFSLWQKASVLIGSSVLLWLIFSSKTFDKWFARLVNYLLKKYTSLKLRDYAAIMHLTKNYEIAELTVTDENWLAKKTLAESRLRNEGVSVMGITRKDGTFLGAPGGGVQILPGDLLLVYGKCSSIKNINYRKKGEQGKLAHEKLVRQNEQRKKKQS